MLVVLITMRKNKEKKDRKMVSSNVIIIDDNTAYEVSWLLSQESEGKES